MSQWLACTQEPYLRKRDLARHYGYSPRWVELRMREGLPSRLIGGERRYLLSQTDAWLAERAASTNARRA